MLSIKRTSISYLIAAVAALLLPLAASGYQAERAFPVHVSPGKVVSSEEMGLGEQGAKRPSAVGASITVDSDDYDPTGLGKFIPGSAFIPINGPGVDQDAVNYDTGGCISAQTDAGGATSTLFAPIELPNHASLNSVIFYFVDNSDDHDIEFSVRRAEITFDGPVGTLDTDVLASGSTVGQTGPSAVIVNVSPDDVTGTVPTLGARFYTLKAGFVNDAGTATKLCGAWVIYQVPASGDNQTFTPITPCKIFDSRPVQGGTGVFAANEIRTITVTGDTGPQGGAAGGCGIPFAATAVQVNFVVVDPLGTGSLKLWAPASAEPAGLLAYQSGIMSFWNGSGTVPISSSGGEKKMRVKTNFSGAHVYIAVTGYTSPVSNMGN